MVGALDILLKCLCVCLFAKGAIIFYREGARLFVGGGVAPMGAIGDMETFLSYYNSSTVCASESQGGTPLARR